MEGARKIQHAKERATDDPKERGQISPEPTFFLHPIPDLHPLRLRVCYEALCPPLPGLARAAGTDHGSGAFAAVITPAW